MKVTLFPYERRVLESLESKFRLEREVVFGVALSLRKFRELFESVIHHRDVEFRQGRIVVAGFINHAQHLLVGGLNALDQGNTLVWSACVRGLIEIFGACVLVKEQSACVPNFLEDRIKAGRLRAAAERGHPGLGGDIDRLNKAVHPTSGAVLAGFRVLDPADQTALMGYGCEQPQRDDGREGVNVLANLAAEIGAKLKDLSGNSAVLQTGRIVMVRTNSSENSGS